MNTREKPLSPEELQELRTFLSSDLAGDPPVPKCIDDGRPISRILVNVELLEAELDRVNGLLNSPELHDFSKAVVLEAAHQRERWGVEHDGGKEPQDWFWLIGYLAGKAMRAHIGANDEKALHHVITAAAALANWHAAISGTDTRMRPGIKPPEGT